MLGFALHGQSNVLIQSPGVDGSAVIAGEERIQDLKRNKILICNNQIILIKK